MRSEDKPNLINFAEVGRILQKSSGRGNIQRTYKGKKYRRAIRRVKRVELALERYLKEFDPKQK
jgi:hypothetical protein